MRSVPRRILFRWLFAKRQLAQALKSVLPELQKGDVDSAIKAINDFWSVLDVSETPGDLGSVTQIHTEWFYALGPKDKNRFEGMFRSSKRLRSSWCLRETEG